MLQQPYCRANPKHCMFLVTNPLDGLTLRIKIAFFGGFLLSSPILFWEAWRFITPGLKAKERRYALPFVGLVDPLLLRRACTVAYFIFGRAISFLESIGGHSLVTEYNPNQYLGLFVLMMFIFGVTFEFPVVLVAPRTRRHRHARQLLLLVALRPHRDHRRLGGHHARAATPSRCWRSRSRSRSSTSWPSASASCCVSDRRGATASRFIDGLGFGLDPFQLEAIDAIDEHVNVLVSAPDRLGQDPDRQLRDRSGPRARGARLLHDAPQGPVEPEVQGAERALRRAPRRTADGRHVDQPQRRRHRHDDRGAAQHAAHRVAPAR